MGNDPVNNTDPSGGSILPIPMVFKVGTVVGGAGSIASAATSVVSTASKIGSVASMVFKAASVANRLINTDVTTHQIGDPLSNDNLSNNPDFYSLGLGDVRGMVKDYDRNLEQWQVNISAGLLLEDLYAAFSGLVKNYSSRLVFGPNPDGIFPIYRRIVPDFFPGSELVNDAIFPDGGITEVKAIQEKIDISTSNYQISAELSTASHATAFRQGKPDYGSQNAGERKAAAITIVIPGDRVITDNLIIIATELGVNVFVSYPFINKVTRKIVFSTPQKLNTISNLTPYKVAGNIDGVTPNIKKATEKFRVQEKEDIDE